MGILPPHFVGRVHMLTNWGWDCRNNGFSCGRLYFVGGGSLTFGYQSAFGPFLS